MPPEVTAAERDVADGVGTLEDEPEELDEREELPELGEESFVAAEESEEPVEEPDDRTEPVEEPPDELLADVPDVFAPPDPLVDAEVAADEVPGISLATTTPKTAAMPDAPTATARDKLRTRLRAACLAFGPNEPVESFMVVDLLGSGGLV